MTDVDTVLERLLTNARLKLLLTTNGQKYVPILKNVPFYSIPDIEARKKLFDDMLAVSTNDEVVEFLLHASILIEQIVDSVGIDVLDLNDDLFGDYTILNDDMFPEQLAITVNDQMKKSVFTTLIFVCKLR